MCVECLPLCNKCMNNPGVKNSWEISTCTEQFSRKRFTARAEISHSVQARTCGDNNPKISMANKKKVWKCYIIVTLSVWYLQNLTILMIRAAFPPCSSHLFSFLFTARIRNIQQRNGEDELSEKHIDCERKPKIPFSQLHQSIYC